MKNNLMPQFEQDVETIRQMFLTTFPDIFSIEDGDMLVVKTPMLVTPDAKNEDWKYKTALGFWLEPLSYYNDYRKTKSRQVITQLILWYKCSFSISYDKTLKYPEDEPRVREITKWFTDNILKKSPLKPFHDEDAYGGYYSWEKRKNTEMIIFSFYINPDFPDGWWENHVL